MLMLTSEAHNGNTNNNDNNNTNNNNNNSNKAYLYCKLKLKGYAYCCVTGAEDRAKRTVESRFLEPPRETIIGLKVGEKITVFD